MKGRPSKMTPEFLEAADAVLSEDNAVLILTDAELLDEINDLLPTEARISLSTFEYWKAGKYGDSELVADFLGLLKRALRIQKRNLFKRLEKGVPGEWQKYAWIIERKFADWNLKRISEVSGPDGRPLEHRVQLHDNDTVSDDIG